MPRFNQMDAVRVTLAKGGHLDCIITDVQTPEYRRAHQIEWPWPDRIKLIVVYLDQQGWAQTWYHDDDDGVQLHPDADQLLAEWAAYTLINGKEPRLKRGPAADRHSSARDITFNVCDFYDELTQSRQRSGEMKE